MIQTVYQYDKTVVVLVVLLGLSSSSSSSTSSSFVVTVTHYRQYHGQNFFTVTTCLLHGPTGMRHRSNSNRNRKLIPEL